MKQEVILQLAYGKARIEIFGKLEKIDVIRLKRMIKAMYVPEYLKMKSKKK